MLGKKIVFSGDGRSQKAKKNILASAAIKGLDSLVHILIVPLTLGYLNAYEYGIWMTLNSFLSWINAFDIGLGSGLRNKLGEAVAENDWSKGRAYVSTTFIMLIFLAIVILAGGAVLIKTINWYRLLNVSHDNVGDLESIILISFSIFCLNFVMKFIGNIYQALQLPAINSLISFCGHLLSLIVIFVLTRVTTGSLYFVAFVYSISPLVIYSICYPITFFKLYPSLSPSISFFKHSYLSSLFSLSFWFFILQIMGIILFSLSNILISNVFGPDQVTPYDIANRYYSLLLMVSNFFMAPIWAASTDAYAKGEMSWIKTCSNKLVRLLGICAIVIVIMILCSSFVYKVWVGDDVYVSFGLSALMGIYVFVLIWSLSFSSILNGMGKLKIQAFNIIVAAVLFYPICYNCAKLFGVTGVVIGMCLVNLPGALLNTIQLRKILNGSAKGFWNK